MLFRSQRRRREVPRRRRSRQIMPQGDTSEPVWSTQMPILPPSSGLPLVPLRWALEAYEAVCAKRGSLLISCPACHSYAREIPEWAVLLTHASSKGRKRWQCCAGRRTRSWPDLPRWLCTGRSGSPPGQKSRWLWHLQMVHSMDDTISVNH